MEPFGLSEGLDSAALGTGVDDFSGVDGFENFGDAEVLSRSRSDLACASMNCLNKQVKNKCKVSSDEGKKDQKLTEGWDWIGKMSRICRSGWSLNCGNSGWPGDGVWSMR